MTRILLRALNGPILILFVILGIALQSSLFTSWPFSYLQPDIVLLAVVWCSLKRGLEEGGILTLIMSEIAEIHSAVPQGLFFVSYMSVYLLIRGLSRFLVIPSLFSFATLTFLASMLWKLIGLLVLSLLGEAGDQWKHTFTFLILGAAIEGIFSLWVFRWLDRFDWITYKNAKAEHAVEEELQLDSEGF